MQAAHTLSSLMGVSDMLNGEKDNPPKMECLCKGTSHITCVNVSAKGTCVMGCTAQCNYGQGLGTMDLGSLAPGLRVRGPLDAK